MDKAEFLKNDYIPLLKKLKGDEKGNFGKLSPQGMIEHTLLKMQRRVFQTNPKATLADLQKEMMKQPETLKKFGQDWVHYQVDGAADAIRYLADHGIPIRL